MSAPKRIGIALVEACGAYLVGTRGAEGPLAGYAEFPGGKCLPDEAPETCAIRECFEETGLPVTVERLLLRQEFTYPHARVDLHFFLCHPEHPAKIADEHQGFRWVPARELGSLKFPEANEPVVALLTKSPVAWDRERICLFPTEFNPPELAHQIHTRVCRTDFTQPGFCLLNLGTSLNSTQFRQLMVDITRQMAAIQQSNTGKTLVYVSAGRFDQQTTTRPHLDGGPDESLLMLGYEPSQVQAEVEISDYARCANDLQMTPKEFMARHNPMFHAGFEMLRPYACQLHEFDPSAWQIVVVNNSSSPMDGRSWQGALHTATILSPDDSQRRVINSTMIARAEPGTPDVLSAAALDEFIHTSLVRRKGYGTPELDDDV